MPTASKLIAAIWFSALMWFASQLAMATMPGGTQFGYFQIVAAATGLLMGWRFLGPRAGDTVVSMISYGLTTSVISTFWLLLIVAGDEMLERALQRRYDGGTEALEAVVDLMFEFGKAGLNDDVLIALGIGGLIGGWLVYVIEKRWS